MKKGSQHLGLQDIDADNFETVALTVFRHQVEHCAAYRTYAHLLNVDVLAVSRLEDIPYLPIEIFKSHRVISERETPEIVFKSSGTTGNTTSRHEVADLHLYQKSFTLGFESVYGKAINYCILGLLPSYLDQGDSSLVYMVDHLIQASGHERSGFYLHNYEALFATLQELQAQKTPTILFGVTYALLDMAEQFPMDFSDLIIIETGGMKGRRKEMIREELHQILSDRLGSQHIHSEYGMTELLSQAYSAENERFYCPPWMRVTIQDLHDPKMTVTYGKTGKIHVIDLANINSCSFISTNDLGQQFDDGSFKVLGRIDHSDRRGCNLMVV